MHSIKIAIDGPSGAGKSTIAKVLAEKLGYTYIDTGAMYRAVGYYAFLNKVDVSDENSLAEILPNADIDIKYESGIQHIILCGIDVSDKIRLPEMSAAASAVARHMSVRRRLVDIQRKLADKYSVIMDGRDIGTCVLKDADIKFFVTADINIRAKRRYDELILRGTPQDFDAVLSDMKKRDYNDSHRKISPLVQADDAVFVDTSEMDFDTSVNHMYNIIIQMLAAKNMTISKEEIK